MENIVRISRNVIYVKSGNVILPVHRQKTTANGKKNQPIALKRRSRSAGRSYSKPKNDRRGTSEPRYVEQAKELPESKIITENLTNKQINEIMLKLELQGAIRKVKLGNLNLEQLDAIHNIIHQGEKKDQPKIDIPDAPEIINKSTHELAQSCAAMGNLNLNDILLDNIDFTADFSAWLDRNWCGEFSMLLNMAQEIETSENVLSSDTKPLKSVTAIQEDGNSTGDKSINWSKEYELMFGNESLIYSSDDDFDWSKKYVTLFGCPSEN